MLYKLSISKSDKKNVSAKVVWSSIPGKETKKSKVYCYFDTSETMSVFRYLQQLGTCELEKKTKEKSLLYVMLRNEIFMKYEILVMKFF